VQISPMRRSDAFTPDELAQIKASPVATLENLEPERMESARMNMYERRSGVIDIAAMFQMKDGRQIAFRSGRGASVARTVSKVSRSVQDPTGAAGRNGSASLGQQCRG